VPDASKQNQRPSFSPSDREPLSENRRRDPRFGVELDVTLESDHNFYAGFVENLSVSGIFVATHTKRQIGELVEFSIRFSKDEEPITGVGEVRWIRQFSETSDTPPGIGLRFKKLADGAEARIDAFLKNRDPLFFDDD
jgi:uncharacterized protein (TIGR02266 family)